jgi:hypothetical protein
MDGGTPMLVISPTLQGADLMGLFQWFDTKEVDQLAETIAAELVKRVPPQKLDERDAKAAKRLQNTHSSIFARASTFAQLHKLNLYKKARLGNQFRWALKEAGYPPDFIESWTYELVRLITLKASAQKAGDTR